MKLIHKAIDGDGAGTVKLVPENGEDLWHVYNLVAKDDLCLATTLRKVTKESASGKQDSERIKLKLQVAVEATEFDPEAEELRLKGQNLSENEHVRLGAYHTLSIEPQRPLSITKPLWDEVHLGVIEQACNPAASADLAAVLIEEGVAHVCLVGGSCTFLKAKIEQNMPRKRGAAAAGYDKALEKFFEKVLQAVLANVNFDVVRCLVLAGPGFVKDQLHTYMLQEAQRRELSGLQTHKSSLLLAHASSGYKHALKEVLMQPAVANQIKDTKAAAEVRALDSFYSMLSNDSTRAFYGPGHVMAAHEHLAIDTLLIADSLFQSMDLVERTKWVAMVESVRAANGTVHIFSSMHISGEQLQQLTGVAAILRFPLPEIEDMEF